MKDIFGYVSDALEKNKRDYLIKKCRLYKSCPEKRKELP